eukprot:78800-Pleurochrysis_carterae.AAC.1
MPRPSCNDQCRVGREPFTYDRCASLCTMKHDGLLSRTCKSSLTVQLSISQRPRWRERRAAARARKLDVSSKHRPRSASQHPKSYGSLCCPMTTDDRHGCRPVELKKVKISISSSLSETQTQAYN